MSEKLSIDYEVRDKASAALHDVNKGLKESRGELGDLNKETGDWNVQAVKGKQSATGLSGAFSKFAGPAAVVTGGLFLINKGLQKSIELNEKLAEYQAVQGDLKQSIENTGLSAAQAGEVYDKLQARIRATSEEVGVSVTELSKAMRELTTRTGDASVANENMNRVLALSHQSGKAYTEVAKSLGQALTGDLGPMKELGILSDAQVTKFRGMTESGEGVSAMLEVLDQKTKGFAKGLPESAINAGRLDAALERLEVAFSDLVGVDTVVGAMSSAIETATGWVESFVDGWNRVPGAVRNAKKEMDSLPGSDGSDRSSFETRLRMQNQEIEAVKWKAAQQRKAIKAADEVWMREEAALKRIDQMEQDHILTIKERHQATRSGVTDSLDARLRILKLEEKILNTRDQQAQFDLKTHKQVQEIAYQREQSLAAATSEAERSKLETIYGLTINNLLQKRAEEWERVAESRGKAEAAAPDDEAAFQRQLDNFRWEMDKKRQRQKAQRDLEEKQHQIMAAAEAAREVSKIEREAIARDLEIWREANEEKKRETREQVSAQREAMRIGFDAGGFTSDGAALIGEYNDRLAEQVRLFGDLSGEIGTMAGALDEVFNKQWDFAKAVDTTVGGIDALASAGGAAAGILGDSVSEQAGIRAGFEGAAAVAAIAAGLMFPDPRYWASAAQHTAAAAMFGVISGTSAGKTSTASAGGGGRGGSSQSAPSIDFGAAFETQKRAYLEALRESRQEGQSATIINNFSGTFLERDRTTMRRVRNVLNESDRLTVG